MGQVLLEYIVKNACRHVKSDYNNRNYSPLSDFDGRVNGLSVSSLGKTTHADWLKVGLNWKGLQHHYTEDEE